MRLRGLLLVPLVLAGCTGGGHAAPKLHGVYRATVRDPGHHAIRTVWLDAVTGRFRVRTVFSKVGTTPIAATVTVFDGRVATQRVGRSRLIRITGSREFVADRAGAAVVAPVRATLAGSARADGVTVVGVRRLRHVDPDIFRASSGPPTGTVNQVSAGRSASGAEPAYWLGSTWRGTAPASASESTGDAGTTYETEYPGLDVTVETSRGAGLGCDGTPVHLADGSSATLVVVPVSPQGTGQCSSSSGGSTIGLMVFSEDAATRTLAYVVAGDTVISLSGRAVTPDSAAAIARALRPV